MRGRTRKSIGDRPKVASASISSLTCIVPSSAANAAPVRPARMMPTIIGGHLARHADRHQIGDVDLRAELHQLERAEEGQDHADQEADQADDRQRAGADLLQQQQEIDRGGSARGRAAAGRTRARSRRGSSSTSPAPRPIACVRWPIRVSSARAAAGCRAAPCSGTAAARRSRRNAPSGSPLGSSTSWRAAPSRSSLSRKVIRPLSQSASPAPSSTRRRPPCAASSRWTSSAPRQRAAQPPAAGERQAEPPRARGVGRQP